MCIRDRLNRTVILSPIRITSFVERPPATEAVEGECEPDAPQPVRRVQAKRALKQANIFMGGIKIRRFPNLAFGW